MSHDDGHQPLAERPPAQFARHLMGAYLAGAGHEVEALLARDDEPARQILARASAYASGKASEVHVRERRAWTAYAVPTPHLHE